MLRPRHWTPFPSWYCASQQPQERDTWKAKLERLDGLLQKCTPKSSWDAFHALRQGNECICPTKCKAFFDTSSDFKLKLKGKYAAKSKSLNRGYIQVEPLAWDSNDFSFYLHTFICYALHGPPPPDMHNPCAAHSCHHRLCLNPFHIRWVSKSDDKKEDWGHRKRRRGS